MNINTIDLNLFLAFHAVYDCRSVTQAGERIGMTQSAVSNALKRLRERFDDPLFVRTAEGMVPTPLTERLIGPIEAGLVQFNLALHQGRTFEPQASERVFRLALNEVGHQVMLPRLLRALRGQAPRVRLETCDAGLSDVRQQMLQGQVDLAIGSWDALGPTFYQQRLFEESFVVLLRKNHPYHTEGGGVERYLEAEHLSYRPHGNTDQELQQALRQARLNEQRRVVLSVGHFAGLPEIVCDTGLLLTVPARLAQALVARDEQLAMMPLPVQLSPFRISQQWHERVHQDQGQRWLREVVFSLFHLPGGPTRRPREWAALAAVA